MGYTPHLAAGVWVGYDQPRTIMRNGYAGDLAVPLWGRFMTAATRGDKPDNFKAPPTITSATICRISGKLATGDCYGAESVDRNGNIVGGQSVYTEYFVRGTEPVDYCPYHTHIATPPTTIFASSSPQPARPAPAPAAVPVPIATSGAMPATTTAAAPTDAPPPAAQEAPRRGFWGRFFRRGGNGATNPPQAAPEPAAMLPATR